jgi:hypothetical protein
MSNTITPIIGGINNISIGTCGSIGAQGSIGTCGSIGIGSTVGITGLQGTAGPRGYQITDWKEDMMKKYPRFTIKTDYDTMSFAPTNIITDTRTNKEYEFTPQSISNIVEETDLFIKQLIVTIREDKINNIINGTES